MSIVILFVILLGLMFFGAPVAAAIGITNIVYLNDAGYNFSIFIQRMYANVNSTSLLALPGFIITGYLMDVGGLARRMVRFFEMITGRMTGGLALCNTATCAAFGAISGSSQATVAAIGGIMVPEMEKRGYPRPFSVALSAAGGVLDACIPPSTGIVVYCATVGTSVAAMFKGGFAIGAILTIGCLCVAYFKSRALKIPRAEFHFTMRDRLKITKDASLALLFPVIIFGGIFTGWFTPTEAAVISILYSFIIGKFVYKELTVKKFFEVLRKASVTTSTVIIITSVATCFGWIISAERVAQSVLDAFFTLSSNKYIILLLINFALLVMGLFMNGYSIILIAAPVFAPIAVSLGLHPIQFAMMFHTITLLGFLTPPFGSLLYVGSSLFEVPVMRLAREVLPFVLIFLVIALIQMFFPIALLFG